MNLPLRPLVALVLVGLSTPPGGDILIAGERPVDHEIYVEAPPGLLADKRLILHPTAGFRGAREVVPGAPFTVQSNYEPFLYLVPRGETFVEDPSAGGTLRVSSGVAKIPVDCRVVHSVPESDSAASFITRARLAPDGRGGYRLVESEFFAYDARGKLLVAPAEYFANARIEIGRRGAASPWVLTALTVLCESLIALLLAPAGTRRRTLVVAVLANLATHPAAWFGLSALGGGWAAWAAVEGAVALVEGVAYRRFARHALVTAATTTLAANCTTAAVGLWLG